MEGKGLDSCPPDLKLVAHPRAKSKVWKYFGFDSDAEGCILQWKKIYCRICMAQIAYSGNTSNLSYHLEKNHPEEFCEFVKSNTEQMREAFATAFSKLKPESSQLAAQAPLASAKAGHRQEAERQQELTAAVLGLICEGLYPASIVEEPTFRGLLKAADPWYELPPRKFFCGKAIPEKYGSVREAVRKELADAPWCGLSADVWRSHSQNRTYVTLAAHFLGGGPPHGLCPGSRCLKTFEVPDENAAETITRVLYEAFIEWGISAKVSGATTDGGKDVAKACSLLDIAVQMPCLGHTFDAGIRQAFQLPKLGALLARCRRLVDYFQQSPVARFMLREKQKLQRRAPCMLVSDRVSWWGGTLAMLQRLLEQQFAIAGVLVEDSNNHHLMLEAAEWAAIEGLVELLQPFKQVADMLSASRHPTVSMVKPLLHMLLSSTLTVKETDSKETSMAKEVIAKALAETYQETPEIDMFLNVATFLDPRYKKLPFLSAFERQQVENRVLEEAKGLLDKGKDGAPAAAEDKAFGPPEEPPAKKLGLASTPLPPPTSVINSMLAEIFCPTGGVEDQEELHAQLLEELSNFKSQKVLGLGEDPLRWWSDRLALFPVLPKVLRKYWCVAATCVPPERLFGAAANVVSAKRNRLAPAHVDEQVFLYENSRAGAEPEPEGEDEGDWGLDQEQAFTFGEAVHSGFFGVRDAFPHQAGRVAIVTGGTEGIGYATCMRLARLGMHVVLAGNDRAKAEGAVRRIKEATLNDKVEFLFCDLASLDSIREFVRTFKAKKIPLHVLINNAGVMMVPQRKTADGFEEHFGLNYLGHFLLTNLLLDTLQESGRPGRSARVVSMSSATHYVGELHLDGLQSSGCYSPHGAYAQSKLALVLFTYHLQRLLAAQGHHVTANAADPGVVDTGLYKHVFWGTRLVKWLFGWWLFKTPDEGAWTPVYTAVSPVLEGVGGRYLYNEKETTSLAVTYNRDLQRELWGRSCVMTGVPDVTPDLLAGRLPRREGAALAGV